MQGTGIRAGARVRTRPLTIRRHFTDEGRADWTETLPPMEGRILHRSGGRYHSCCTCWRTPPTIAPARGRDGTYLVKIDDETVTFPGERPMRVREGRVLVLRFDEFEVIA